MVDRLVLGSGRLVSAIAGSLEDQPGTVRVATDDESLAETLREGGLSVFALDPTDAAALERFDGIDIVALLADDGEWNLAAARAARQAFPDAYTLAYAGDNGSPGAAALATTVDRVIDPARATARYVMQRAGDGGGQARQLRGILRGLDSLAVVTHDNPDPDAIASGVALARLAEAAGCAATVCYFGNINHQENRAFVNVLNLDLRNLEDHEELDAFDGLALVDHSRPGVNDQLPKGTAVDVLIDHHPPQRPVDARFVDLRSDVGATSTLLVDYLEQFDLVDADEVATALLFGIHVDTKGFTREVAERDFRAAATLVPHADLGALERIESPNISAGTLETVAAAIQNRRVEGEILLSCVGHLPDRDALAQAADRLLTLDGVTTCVVYGFSDGTIYVSARARGTEIDLGETLRDAFDQIGSAGGHVDMAGAQITLGVLEAIEDQEAPLQEVVESVVTDRFLEAVDAYLTGESERVYAADTAEEYLEPDADVDHRRPGDGRGGEAIGPGRTLYGDHEDDTPPPPDDAAGGDDRQEITGNDGDGAPDDEGGGGSA